MGDFFDRIGPRARRRATPRVGVALAAAGCVLVVAGALTIGGDNLIGDDGDSGTQLPGIVLSAAVVVGGFVLLAQRRDGPLATAGAVAAAAGVPPLLFFITFDEGSFPPYSTEAILFLSTAVWALSYVVGPGRGRLVFLGAAFVGLWLTALQLVEDVFTSPFALLDPVSPLGFGQDPFAPAGPDPTTIGIISLAFGAGYLVLARRWDRAGFDGAGTGPTVAALIALPFGVSSLAEELEATGAGLLAALVGFAVALHGATVGRRATTWLGAAGVAVGLLVVVVDNIDEATPGGIALIAVGAGVIVGAEALRRGIDEPDELRPSPAEERQAPPVTF